MRGLGSVVHDKESGFGVLVRGDKARGNRWGRRRLHGVARGAFQGGRDGGGGEGEVGSLETSLPSGLSQHHGVTTKGSHLNMALPEMMSSQRARGVRLAGCCHTRRNFDFSLPKAAARRHPDHDPVDGEAE